MLQALFSFRDRYRILHLTWFAFFISFVVWFSEAPFATTIQRELYLSSAQLKVLAICNLALTIPARIVIGIVLDRYGPRLTFSALLVFALVPCLLSATAHDFNQLVWSSLINSIMGAGFVAGVRMVAEWFPSKEIGSSARNLRRLGQLWCSSLWVLSAAASRDDRIFHRRNIELADGDRHCWFRECYLRQHLFSLHPRHPTAAKCISVQGDTVD